MKGRQILVADDEPKMRRVLEIMLQKMGHRVLAAGNKIGGFSAPGGSESKARMLEIEGVVAVPSEAQPKLRTSPTQMGFDF